jgi:hypothetical protein
MRFGLTIDMCYQEGIANIFQVHFWQKFSFSNPIFKKIFKLERSQRKNIAGAWS